MAMDAANRRPQLPALSYLDVNKTDREEESYQNRSSLPPQTHQSAPAASPTYPYPSHPPPPYSHPAPQHSQTWPGQKTPVQTPPDSRRTSGEDSDYVKKTVAARQSLPSISEALGETSYPASTSAPQHLSQSAAPSSPPLSGRRPYPMEPQQPLSTFATGSSYQYPPTFRQDSAGPTYPPSDAPKPAYAPPQETRPPPLHVQTSQTPRSQPAGITYTQTTSPQYEQQQTSQSAGSMGPPTFAYGYTPYPPRPTQPASSSSHAGPIYQPSTQYPAPPTPSPGWKSESAPSRYGTDERFRETAYSESVKRHLDLHDLEGALNEISQTSSIMMDFSRRYGDRMHQSARSAPSLSTLPSMVEVEDMINKSRIQLDSLAKIREVILAQQVAYEQQLADQRQQQKAYPEPHPQAGEHLQAGGEGKDGFAGSDTKKRRGRAAPPGRCHSCNRAETPEWRRGPDGARTLCNACGLHYAKLTRKQTGANKATSVGSSNLRPKEP